MRDSRAEGISVGEVPDTFEGNPRADAEERASRIALEGRYEIRTGGGAGPPPVRSFSD